MITVATRRGLKTALSARLPLATFRSRPSGTLVTFGLAIESRRWISHSARVQAAEKSAHPASNDDKPDVVSRDEPEVAATSATKPKSILARLRPEAESASSLRKLVSLAKPEKKTLSIGVALVRRSLVMKP